MKIMKILVVIAAIIAGVVFFRALSAPAPGIKKEDQGRDHVSPKEVEKFEYNSNPPTSGPHLPTWVKPGMYREPQNEGELIHSLEHGYIIISYNCGVHLSRSVKYQASSIRNLSFFNVQSWEVYAHDEGSLPVEEGSPSAEITIPKEATGSAIADTDACKNLITNLEAVAGKKRLSKLIVVPRPQLDTTIALTAWEYIDSFDGFDERRIERFIDYHRDQGPEKTME